ncbi:MAG: zinc dependent phospholipase C family protein [Bacteroidales bacterium]|nr:zinc dependent phospholipase C family protein [Bacteroidales bacterium]
MKTKDHLALGHFLLNLSDNAGLQKHKRAFLLGCIEPDYNMATYTRGLRNHPKFRGHNAENSYRHITKCLSEFQSDGICSAWDYFTLGTMFHYIADAFTYPHNSFWKGSLLKHAAYEMELHTVFYKELGLRSVKRPITLLPSLTYYFSNTHDEYSAASHTMKVDCRYIIGVCERMFIETMRLADTSAAPEPIMKAVISYENSYNHGLV